MAEQSLGCRWSSCTPAAEEALTTQSSHGSTSFLHNQVLPPPSDSRLSLPNHPIIFSHTPLIIAAPDNSSPDKISPRIEAKRNDLHARLSQQQKPKPKPKPELPKTLVKKTKKSAQIHELLESIKSCQKEKDIWKARKIHADLRKGDLIAKDVFVATALITTYAKCGALEEAREVLEQMLTRDVISWSALISGYAQNGQGYEALRCFQQMQDAGLRPNSLTYVVVLKACSIVGSLEIGEDIHAEVRRQGLLQKDVVLGNALVSMYSKIGVMEKAREVFEQLPLRNVVSWNALLTGYARKGLGEEVLKCFRQMQKVKVRPDAMTYVSVLKGCGILGSLEIGEAINDELRNQRLLEKDVVLGTALLDMYAKCGVMHKAQEVFEQLPERNVVSWSALIAGYAQKGLGDEALKCFKHMKDVGVYPNVVTYISVLKACGIVGSLDVGQEIDMKVRNQGLLQKDVVLGTALVDMYAKCGALEKAREVFDQIIVRNVVSWNALIAGYSQHGLGKEALKCFIEMKDAGICPDEITYVCILKACGIVGSLDIGVGVDAEVRKQGLWQKNIMLGTALVDMYAKCGVLEKAREVFEQLSEQNVVTWSALIAGYVQHGLGYEALKCFRQMKDAGVRQDAVTYISILKACGIVGSLEIGEDIDTEVNQQGLLQKDGVLGTALVDMYSKCGALKKAQKVFEQLPVRDVVSWNALIAGYAQLGHVNAALGFYNSMRAEDVVPNWVSFIILLNACSHAGLLKEGEKLLNVMCSVYSVTPTLEHYTCMIDLFGRAGHFDEVKAWLDKVPYSCYLPLLQSILGSCRKWNNVKLGRWAFEQLVEVDHMCASAYVCMGDIYAAAGMQREAHGIKVLRVKNKAWMKIEHCSWSDANRKMHSFVVGDGSHPQSMHIYAKLEDLHRRLLHKGYFLHLDKVLSQKTTLDRKKEAMSCGHNVKLAIACALLNTHDEIPVCITMNTRLCEDCHSATSLISMIEKRRILVNDATRVHIFHNGKCICSDYCY